MSPYYEKFHTSIVPPEEICAHLGLVQLERNDRIGSGRIETSYAGTVESPLGEGMGQYISNSEFWT